MFSCTGCVYYSCQLLRYAYTYICMNSFCILHALKMCLWGKDSIHWRDLPVSVFIHAFESNRNIYSMYCILKALYMEIIELMHIGGLMRGERLMVHHMQQVISFSQKLYLDYHAPSDFLLTASWRWAAFLEMFGCWNTWTLSLALLWKHHIIFVGVYKSL